MMKIHPESLTSANVQHSMSDARAARLLEAEAKHFSKEEANLVVMDITRMPNGIKAFAPLVQRRFQPGLNRRFGAVALFQEMAESSGRITAA